MTVSEAERTVRRLDVLFTVRIEASFRASRAANDLVETMYRYAVDDIGSEEKVLLVLEFEILANIAAYRSFVEEDCAQR